MDDDLRSDRDPGVAAARTDLAWSRSGLTLLACLALLARRFFPLDGRTDHVAAFLLLGAGGLGWAATLLLGRRARLVAPGSPEAARRLRLAASSAVAVAVAAFLFGLFPP